MAIERKKGRSLIDFPKDYVVLDLETTGLDPSVDSIIEIGAIRYVGCEKTESFSTLVRPDRYMVPLHPDAAFDDYVDIDGEKAYFVDPFITKLTGITNSMLIEAPGIKESIQKAVDFIGDSIVVGHNVNYDINFMYDAYKTYCGKEFANDYVDTLRIAKKLFREFPHHRLKDLSEHYKVDYSSAHRALADCEMTNEILKRMELDVVWTYSTNQEFFDLFTPYSYSGKYSKLSAKEIVPDEGMADEDSPLYGREVVITGTLEKMLRKEAYQLVANIGGIPSDSVKKSTGFLVMSNKEYTEETTKKKRARELISKGFDIEVLSENVFYEMLGIE